MLTRAWNNMLHSNLQLSKIKLFSQNVNVPIFRYHGAQPSQRKPRTPYHVSLVSGVCLDVRTGKSFLNLPWATQHLAMALSHPPTGAQCVAKIVESGFHIKHGTIDIHFSHNSAIDGPRLTLTPGADIVMVFDQSLNYATARLVDPQSTFWGHRMKFLPTPLQQRAQWFLPDFWRTSWPSPETICHGHIIWLQIPGLD